MLQNDAGAHIGHHVGGAAWGHGRGVGGDQVQDLPDVSGGKKREEMSVVWIKKINKTT